MSERPPQLAALTTKQMFMEHATQLPVAAVLALPTKGSIWPSRNSDALPPERCGVTTRGLRSTAISAAMNARSPTFRPRAPSLSQMPACLSEASSSCRYRRKRWYPSLARSCGVEAGRLASDSSSSHSARSVNRGLRLGTEAPRAAPGM
jgi:hypothetical protein